MIPLAYCEDLLLLQKLLISRVVNYKLHSILRNSPCFPGYSVVGRSKVSTLPNV